MAQGRGIPARFRHYFFDREPPSRKVVASHGMELNMIKTLGLTHIHLMVQDMDRALHFYKSVFGMQERFRYGSELVFLNTPGSVDLIALHQAKPEEETGSSGGISHYGFQLEDKAQLDAAVEEVIAAGGKLKQRGEFGPDLPYAYVNDPDGYEIELSPKATQ